MESLIRQQLQTFLQTGDVKNIMKAEKDISFELIFETRSKAFCNIPEAKEGELLGSIVKLTQRFISVNFPDVDAAGVSVQFAVDVINVRPDWNMLDILNFFKFIRQRQDLPENKIFGNKITPLKLMELTAGYENQKSIAREIWHKNESNRIEYGTQQERMMLGAAEQKLIGTGEKFRDNRMSDLAKELADKQKAKSDDVYVNADKTKQFLRDIEQHWKGLMERVQVGQLSEEQAQIEHVKYRDNYYELADKIPS